MKDNEAKNSFERSQEVLVPVLTKVLGTPKENIVIENVPAGGTDGKVVYREVANIPQNYKVALRIDCDGKPYGLIIKAASTQNNESYEVVWFRVAEIAEITDEELLARGVVAERIDSARVNLFLDAVMGKPKDNIDALELIAPVLAGDRYTYEVILKQTDADDNRMKN
jgi:hypothetical protein